jgi:hypothetical protein
LEAYGLGRDILWSLFIQYTNKFKVIYYLKSNLKRFKYC